MKGARMPVLPWGNRSCPFLLACWIVGSIAFTHGASRNKDLRIDALVEDLFNKSSKLVNQQDPATHRGPHLPRPLHTSEVEPSTETPDISPPLKSTDGPDITASPVDTPDDLTQTIEPDTYTTTPSNPNDNPDVAASPVDTPDDLTPQETPKTYTTAPYKTPDDPTYTSGKPSSPPLKSTDGPNVPGGPDSASEMSPPPQTSSNTPDISTGPTETISSLTDASITTNQTSPTSSDTFPVPTSTDVPGSPGGPDSASETPSILTESASTPDILNGPTEASDASTTTNQTLPGDNATLPPTKLTNSPDSSADTDSKSDNLSSSPEPSPDVPADPSSTSDTPSPPPELSSTPDVPASPSTTFDTVSRPPEPSGTPDVPAGPSSTSDTSSPHPELSTTSDVSAGPSSTPDTPSPPPESSSTSDVPAGPSSTPDTTSPPPESSSTPNVPAGPSSTADTPSPPPELSSTPDVPAGPSSTADTPSPPLESSSTSDIPTGTNRTTDSSSPRLESPDSPDLPTAIIDTPDKQPSSKLVDLPFVQTGPANTSDVSTQTGPTDPSYTPYTTGTTNTTELPPSTTSTDSPETPADVPPSLESTDSPDIQTGASPISDSSVSTPTASIDPQSSASTSGQATNLTPAATGEISGSRPTLSSFTSPSAAMDSDNTEVKSSDESKAKPTASAFSVAAVTPEDNSMTHAETHHAMPTVSVRESDASQTQTSDMSYRPTTSSMGSSAPSSSMVADAPTVSMVMHEDSTSEGMDTTHSDSDVMARSEDSRHSSVHAWFKSHKKNTASKDTIIDRKASKTPSKYVNKVNGAEQIYTTIGSQNGPVPMDNVSPSPIRLNNPGGKGKTKFAKKLKVKTVKKVKKKNGNKKVVKAVAKSIKKIIKKGGNKKITKAVVKVKKIIKGKTKLKKTGARKINKNSCFKNTKVCDAIVDLAFLIDGSTAVGMKNFKKSIAFALRVIKNFAVSKLGTHVSVVVFSNQPHVIFDLQAYYNHASLEKAMQNIAYPKIKNPKITYTKLGSGLRVVKTSVFKDSGRLNIPKMLFVMSSSTSADNVKIPALSLRSTGVVIYALGMGSAFSPTQLKTIATYSPIEHVVATRFAYLDCLEPWLARHLCSAAGGRLRKLTISGKARSLIEAGNALKPKAVSKQMLAQRKKMLIEKKKKLAEKKEKIKKHLRMRLHQLLSRLGSGKRKDEELVYRSLIYNINGHRGKGDCKDTHVVCSKWRSEGLCERSTDGFDVQSVQKVCPKSCGICLP